MHGLVASLLLLDGARRLAVAAAFGALAALTLPPIGLLPAAIVGFCGLVLLMDGLGPSSGGRARLFSAFGIGWAFGFGWFVAGLWWIGAAFLVEAERFALLMPLAVAGLPAGLALFTGAGLVIARLLWSEGPGRLAALGVGLGLSELARGTLFTGFPWNAFGYAVAGSDIGMQAAALVGLPGLNVLAPALLAAPVLFLDPAGRARLIGLSAAALTALGIAGYGLLRLATAPEGDVPDVRLRIVQPAITQAERLDRSRHGEIVDRLFALTAKAPAGPADATQIVVWPESTFPFLISHEPTILPRIADALVRGQLLIVGAARGERTSPTEARVFNALYVFDEAARLVDRYDKVHLVPFGEYLPFEDVLSAVGLEALTRRGYTAGTVRRTIALPGAPSFVPLICYETIFPGAVLGEGERPGFIVNLSDDSWFGNTSGPRQHLLQARVRAVEEGLPLIRGTTTGISAVIDSRGRVRADLPLGAMDVIDSGLPPAEAPPPFARFGGLVSHLPGVLLLLIALAARRGSGNRGP